MLTNRLECDLNGLTSSFREITFGNSTPPLKIDSSTPRITRTDIVVHSTTEFNDFGCVLRKGKVLCQFTNYCYTLFHSFLRRFVHFLKNDFISPTTDRIRNYYSCFALPQKVSSRHMRCRLPYMWRTLSTRSWHNRPLAEQRQVPVFSDSRSQQPSAYEWYQTRPSYSIRGFFSDGMRIVVTWASTVASRHCRRLLLQSRCSEEADRRPVCPATARSTL